jgi:hypothetical protein
MLIVFYYSEAMIGSRIMRMPSGLPSWLRKLVFRGLYIVMPDIITVILRLLMFGM